MAKADLDIPPGVKDPARRIVKNPITGEVGTILKYSHETNGEYAEAIATCEPNGGPPLHYHKTFAEHFEALEGEVIVQIGNNEPRTLRIGEKAEVPIGTLHRFSAGSSGGRFKVRVSPGDVGFEKSIYILFGLANDGLTGRDGLPKSTLHTAVVGSLGGMYFPGAGGAILNTMTSALAMYARWSGVEEELIKKYWE